MLKKIIYLLTLSILSLSNVGAEMYKWVDEEGNTHYTQQQPPAGIESETINPPPAFDSSEAEKALKAQQEYLDTERENRQKDAKAQQRTEKEKARQEKNCELSRARLESLTIRSKVSETQDDGSLVVMTEEKRQEEIAKARKLIKELCK